ncbi:MAG TPA: pitrilysin family protein [Kofleriaceae bacterium]|nr:pitrilysin family protein [Kofleriaceae bacterium]
MSIRTTIAAVTAAMVLGTAPAALGQASPLPIIETWTLPNGLQVAHVPSHRAPVVSVQVWYRAGSKDEPANRRGLARVVQHALFQGSTHVRPGDHAAYIARVGGYSDGTTIEDATALQNLVPRQYFELVMRLEADRMRNVEWRPELMKAARALAAQDLARASADPLKQGVWPFLEMVYQKHPYAWESVGRAQDIKKTTDAEARAFYDAYYVPNNALVVVVGDVDRKAVETAATAHFGPIPAGAKPPRPAADKREPPQTEARRKQLAGGEVGLVIRGFHIPEATHEDIYALQVLSLILGSGSRGRLEADLAQRTKARLQAGSSAVVREDPGLFFAWVAFAAGTAPKSIESALFDAVAGVIAKPPTGQELSAVRNLIFSDFGFRLETAAGLAGQVGLSWILTGDSGQFVGDLAELEAVSGNDVARVAKTYLTRENSTTLVIAPSARQN